MNENEKNIYSVTKLRNEELFIQVKADNGEFNVILEALDMCSFSKSIFKDRCILLYRRKQ
ncbi:hypothetical protein C6W27_14325 [Bacillus paralicheniformis]|nr:hypothetical protein C6W27_14325 [Bacillus paralicheniformis]TAI52936.1 hypothetical protein CXP52_05220 [Bacillus paralicheniformis]